MLCKITSTLLQVCFFEAKWVQLGAKLARSWLKLGSCWPKLAPSWAMLAPSWLPLKNPPSSIMPYPPSWPQVGSMLAPCWLHVGSMLAHVGSMLAHVGPSGLQDGSRCHYVDSGWPQDGQHGLQEQILINFWSTIAHFGTPWTLKILKKALVLKVRLHFALFCFSLCLLSL